MSDYLKKLCSENPDAAERYQQKVSIINDTDPYSLANDDMNYDPASFPSITNMDIVAYLVLTTSFYTKQQMKAFKSLQAYKYFDAGFVRICGTLKINNHIVARGNVSYRVVCEAFLRNANIKLLSF